MALLSPFPGVPQNIRLDFSQKIVPALAFNSIIVETIACWGKWNRHTVALSDNFFLFKKKMQIMKIDLDYAHGWQSTHPPTKSSP